MKYELNTPYDFEVRNVIQDNDSLAFEVEVAGNLFPVKAYPEQIEEVVPKTVSCRIMLDKNKNAYLIQNEAFLYPFLYKPEKRYIFEVADIRDGYVVLKDKHGLFHAMELDGTKLSINEIIVRCVNVIVDNGYKAHLSFYYTDIVVEEPKHECPDLVTEEPEVRPIYTPTIFEEDTPELDTLQTIPQVRITPTNTTHLEKNIKKEQGANNEKSVSVLLEEKKWNQLNLYFRKNLRGGKIPVIFKEIEDFVENCKYGSLYWQAIRFLTNYNSQIFLCTIAKANTTHIVDLADTIDRDCLDDIVRKTFSVPDKLKHALELIAICSKQLSVENKNYIQSKCADLNTPESFFKLFKVLRLSPDDAIIYLLSLKDNISAAYTIFRMYAIAKNTNKINESSPIQSFRPSKIDEYTQLMKKMGSYPFSVSSKFISTIILNKEKFPIEDYKEIDLKKYESFYLFVSRRMQKASKRFK